MAAAAKESDTWSKIRDQFKSAVKPHNPSEIKEYTSLSGARYIEAKYGDNIWLLSWQNKNTHVMFSHEHLKTSKSTLIVGEKDPKNLFPILKRNLDKLGQGQLIV
jgi:hypothetical protein